MGSYRQGIRDRLVILMLRALFHSENFCNNCISTFNVNHIIVRTPWSLRTYPFRRSLRIWFFRDVYASTERNVPILISGDVVSERYSNIPQCLWVIEHFSYKSYYLQE